MYAIDTSSGWYYLYCMVCKNKVFKPTVSFDEMIVPIWWCEFCQCIVTKVSPRLFIFNNIFELYKCNSTFSNTIQLNCVFLFRYKLDLLVHDQTGESKFTLLDTEAKLIVKTTAIKIVKLSLAEIIYYLFFKYNNINSCPLTLI